MKRTAISHALACALLATSACGGRSDLIDPRTTPTDAARDAPADAPADTLAPDPDAGRLCGCPGRRIRCVLPRMCCPATQTCEDPARFNCSGSGDPCR